MTMTRWASSAALVLISVAGFIVGARPVGAQTISVTAVVVVVGPPADPIVEFSGVAAPSAAISLLRNGAEITSATASSSASFNFLLSDQPTGQQVYEIRATDTDGRTLSPMTFALNLSAGSTTSVNNIFLGPSIAASPTTVESGQSLAVSGQTYPGSTVTLSISTSPVQHPVATAGSDGRWQATVAAADLGVGSFTVYAQANSSIVGQSEISASITISITAAVVPPTNTNAPQNTNTAPPANTNTTPIRNTNTAPPPVTPCSGKRSADLNCDGRVNLVDLSVLLFYWQQRNPSNTRANVSGEDQVGMVDFSIMLFQWTG